jgi:hypothetical protein
MKKITSYLVISISILVLWSCNKKDGFGNINSQALKTQVFIDTIRGLEKVGSILRFETTDDYVEFIEDTSQVKWDKLADFSSSKGFQNYFVQNPTTNYLDSNLMDESLGQLLNSDGVIIIGEKALKIDLTNSKVYLTNYNNLATNYQSLIIGDTINKAVLSFSTDDDIIDYLLFGYIEKCGGSSHFNKFSDPIDVSEDNDDDFIQWNARYFKAGIYFSVYANAFHYYPVIGLPNYDNVKFEIQQDIPNSKALRLKPRPCTGNNNIYIQGGVTEFDGYGPFGTSTNPIRRAYKVYSGIRGLNGYRVKIRGVYEKPSGDIVYTNWIGSEVNSNF